MKKILCLTLMMVFLLSGTIAIASCNGGNNEPTQPPKNGETPTTPEQPTETVVPNEIEITDDGFNPVELTIKVGETVTWYNKSDRRWWVSSPTKVPDTGVIPLGIRMTYTFKEVGEFEYYDLYHREVTGKIIVVAE